jgi:hypothetical protein
MAGVPQPLLHVLDVLAEQQRRAGVAEGMEADRKLTSRRKPPSPWCPPETGEVHGINLDAESDCLTQGVPNQGAPADERAVRQQRARLAGELELPGDERRTVDGCLRQIDFLDGEVRMLEEIAQHALASEDIQRLMTVPGVSLTTAATFIAAVGVIGGSSGPRLVGYLGRGCGRDTGARILKAVRAASAAGLHAPTARALARRSPAPGRPLASEVATGKTHLHFIRAQAPQPPDRHGGRLTATPAPPGGPNCSPTDPARGLTGSAQQLPRDGAAAASRLGGSALAFPSLGDGRMAVGPGSLPLELGGKGEQGSLLVGPRDQLDGQRQAGRRHPRR